jgi:hypothetical protein
VTEEFFRGFITKLSALYPNAEIMKISPEEAEMMKIKIAERTI